MDQEEIIKEIMRLQQEALDKTGITYAVASDSAAAV